MEDITMSAESSSGDGLSWKRKPIHMDADDDDDDEEDDLDDNGDDNLIEIKAEEEEVQDLEMVEDEKDDLKSSEGFSEKAQELDKDSNEEQPKSLKYQKLYDSIEKKLINSIKVMECTEDSNNPSINPKSTFFDNFVVSLRDLEEKLRPSELIEIALDSGAVRVTMETAAGHEVLVQFWEESSKTAILEKYKDNDLIEVTTRNADMLGQDGVLKVPYNKTDKEFFRGYVNLIKQWYSDEFPHLAALKNDENEGDILRTIWKWYFYYATDSTLQPFLENLNKECGNAEAKNLKLDWFDVASKSGYTVFPRCPNTINQTSNAKSRVVLMQANAKSITLVDSLEMLISYGKIKSLYINHHANVQISCIEYESASSSLSLAKDFRQLKHQGLVLRTHLLVQMGSGFGMRSKIGDSDVDYFAEVLKFHKSLAAGGGSFAESYAQMANPMLTTTQIFIGYWQLMTETKVNRDALAEYISRIGKRKGLDKLLGGNEAKKIANEIKTDILNEFVSKQEKNKISGTEDESGLNISPKRDCPSHVILDSVDLSDLASNDIGDSDTELDPNPEDCRVVLTLMQSVLELNLTIPVVINAGLKFGKIKKLRFFTKTKQRKGQQQLLIIIEFDKKSAASGMVSEFPQRFNMERQGVKLVSIEPYKLDLGNFIMEAPNEGGPFDFFEEFVKFWKQWYDIVYDDPEGNYVALKEVSFRRFLAVIWRAYWDLKFAHQTVQIDEFIQKLLTFSEFTEGNPNADTTTICLNLQEIIHFEQSLTECSIHCPISKILKDKVVLMTAKEPMDIPIPMVEKAITVGRVLRIKFHNIGDQFNAATIQMESAEDAAKLVMESCDEYTIVMSTDALLPVSFATPNLQTGKWVRTVELNNYFKHMLDFYKCFTNPENGMLKWAKDWSTIKSSWFIYYQILNGRRACQSYIGLDAEYEGFKVAMYLPFIIAFFVAHKLEIYKYVHNSPASVRDKTATSNQGKESKKSNQRSRQGFKDQGQKPIHNRLTGKRKRFGIEVSDRLENKDMKYRGNRQHFPDPWAGPIHGFEDISLQGSRGFQGMMHRQLAMANSGRLFSAPDNFQPDGRNMYNRLNSLPGRSGVHEIEYGGNAWRGTRESNPSSMLRVDPYQRNFSQEPLGFTAMRNIDRFERDSYEADRNEIHRIERDRIVRNRYGAGMGPSVPSNFGNKYHEGSHNSYRGVSSRGSDRYSLDQQVTDRSKQNHHSSSRGSYAAGQSGSSPLESSYGRFNSSKPPSSTTATKFSQKGSNGATVSPIKYLALLCELSDYLGPLGKTLLKINQEATESSDQGYDPLDVVRIDENESIIRFAKIRLKKLVDDQSLKEDEVFMVKKGVDACGNILKLISS